MSAEQYKADLPDMQAWARGIMAHRPPDFTVGEDYMRRWWVIPRNDFANVYLHEFRASDDDRAMHDHPWRSTSVILFGQYIEHTPEGPFLRMAGDVVERQADSLHRIELLANRETGEMDPAISLFFTGPNAREWGFDCQHGWVHWKDFVDNRDSGAVGRRCLIGSTTSSTASAARLATNEVERATAKFPTWPTDPLHALAVLGEEFGELTKATLQAVYEPHKSSMADVREEAIQCAAMALRFVMSLDQYQLITCDQHRQEEL